MKYLLLAIAALSINTTLMAQDQQLIEMNSTTSDAHLHLYETETGDRARLEFSTKATFSEVLNGEYGTWKIEARSTGSGSDNSFAILYDQNPPGGSLFDLFQIQATGNATLFGTLTQGSDRNRKENITAISNAEILDKIALLEITQWNYIGEEYSHIGPMAQDFYASFGLGSTNKGIAAIDSDGVALAAIKALKAENDALKLQLAKLAARVDGIMK